MSKTSLSSMYFFYNLNKSSATISNTIHFDNALNSTIYLNSPSENAQKTLNEAPLFKFSNQDVFLSKVTGSILETNTSIAPCHKIYIRLLCYP